MEPHERRLPGLVLVPVVVTSALVGLALSVLGWSGWLLGAAVLVLGLVGRTTGARWADWAVPVGVGLVLGTLASLLMAGDGRAGAAGAELGVPEHVQGGDDLSRRG